FQVASREAIRWKCMSHPNVVPFLGFDIEHFNIGAVGKWMPNGHIKRFLEYHPSASRPQLILDIARGLQYLHSEDVNIVHGELKGTNILVDEHNRACLSDFGLWFVTEGFHSLFTRANNEATARWTAPEILSPEDFAVVSSGMPSRESDIYSFSLVMWEVFAGKVPFTEARNDGAVIRRILNGDRPQRLLETTSLGLSDNVWSMMDKCWSADPRMRLSVSQVIAILENEWHQCSSRGRPTADFHGDRRKGVLDSMSP
ncbi:kinase-like protein, partial [Daedalea quercina L-15889]